MTLVTCWTSRSRLKCGLGRPSHKRPRSITPDRKWIKEQVQTLLEKGVLGVAEPGAFLHCVVLVGGREDQPAHSGQAYRLCTDFREVNRRTVIDGYPALNL